MWPFFCRFEVDEVWRAIVTRKKTLRKLSAALLSAAMCFGFLIPVFAEGEGDNPSFAQTENMPVSNTEPSAGNTEISEPQSDASAAQGNPDPTSDQSTESPDAAADDSVQDAEESSDSSSSSDESTSSTDSKPSDSYSEADGEIGKEENESSEDANEKDGSSEEETPAKPVQFEKTADLIHVTAKTTSDILPEDAEMRVKLYSDQDEGFRAAENALNSSQVNYDGLLVVDVSFWKDGKEIEPEDGTVDVQMSFDKTLVDDEKTENSLQVHHISEKDGIKVEKVACESKQTIQDANETYKAEFKVDSFSSFTITWYRKDTQTAYIDLNLVDEYGQTLDTEPQSEPLNTSGWDTTVTVDLKDYAKKCTIDGYTFVRGEKTDDSGNSQIIDQIKLTYSREFVWGSGYNTSVKAEYLYQNGPVYEETKNPGDHFAADLVFAPVDPEPETSTLTFNKNGGSIDAPDPVNGSIGDSVILPDYEGTRQGYRFLGWSTGTNLNSMDYYPLFKVGSTFQLTEKSHTLYAVWTPTNPNTEALFFIRLDGQIPNEPASYNNEQYVGTITLPNAIQEKRWVIDTSHRTGEYLKGVNAQNDVTDRLNDVPTADQIKSIYSSFDPDTQYVLWYVQKRENNGWHVDGVLLDKEKVNVSYDRNCPDENVIVPKGYQRDPNTKITIGHNNAGEMVTPVRDGYIFLGWSKTPDALEGDRYHNGDSYVLTEDTTFYAQWALDIDQLTVTKYIEGNMGDKSKKFEFQVQIKDRNGNVYTDASKELTLVDGWYTFELTNGQSYVFKVPKGGTYQVKEDPKEYVAEYTISGGHTESRKQGKDTDVRNFNGLTEVVFHNVKETAVPGGLRDDGEQSSALVTGGALGILALAAYSLIFRKEREHEQR